MPWHPLHCLGKQNRVWAGWQLPAGSTLLLPTGIGVSHSQVTLSPSAAWQMRYLASAPGQAARGDGFHWRTTAASAALMLMGTASESVCKKTREIISGTPLLE